MRLAEGVEVRFTGRADGDLGATTAHDASVAANRERLRRAEGLVAIAGATQVHGASIRRVADGSPGYVVAELAADGLVTALPRVGLAVHVADCLPIAIAGRGGVAMLHGGWRGLAAGIVDRGVSELRSIGVDGPLAAAIGPGAGGCCYEAGEEVHASFAELDVHHGRLLDLKAVARHQLKDAGVADVHDVELCTLCAPAGQLFSHRRDGPATGRQAGIAWLI